METETERIDATGYGADEVRRLGEMLGVLPGGLDRFAELCDGVRDWSALMSAAAEHGVGLTIEHYASKAGRRLPDGNRQALRRQGFLQRVRQREIYEAALAVVATLDGAGVRSVPLKGPVLAERLYEEPLARPSHDLDVLVDVEDLDRASAALVGMGYVAVDPEATAEYNRKYHHHVNFLHPSELCHLELHFRALTLLGTEIPAREVLDRARPYTTASGARLLVLSPEDELLYLVAHAVGHFVVVLKWLLDVHLLLDEHLDLDWDTVRARAREWQLESALAFGLEDLERVLRVPPIAGRPSVAPWRRAGVGVLRALDARLPDLSAVHTTMGLVYSSLLCDHASTSVRFLGHNFGRIARRRAHGLLPRLTPDDWAG